MLSEETFEETKTDIHLKGFALGLALKKWSIPCG